MISDIDARMKEQYEDRYRFMLVRRTYTIIRVDGRAFHTWTRGLERPYSVELMRVMDEVALALCQEIAGAQLAYVQSDEISVLLTDFAKVDTHAWFDNNLQKLCSISASIATAKFNAVFWEQSILPLLRDPKLAHFDSRVFQIPDPVEVENYFVARQKDAVRNSVSMLAQGHFSHKQLHEVPTAKMHDMLVAVGDNWNDHPARFKQGAAIAPVMQPAYLKKTKVGMIEIPAHDEWGVIADTPIFTKDREWLSSRIPRYPI